MGGCGNPNRPKLAWGLEKDSREEVMPELKPEVEGQG